MKLILMLWLTLMIFHEHYQIGSCFSNNLFNNTEDRNQDHLCRWEQRQWLLQLKQQLVHQPAAFEYKPMSWNKSSDCCVWDGITCDESTGDVIGLDLSASGLQGHINSNSSLFHLTHLQKLNLANNDFSGSKLPFNFGSLKSLTHLNLSLSGFEGQTPTEFYHLSSLVSLDLGWNDINLDIKMLFQNMTEIRLLLLPAVNISSEMPINMSSFLIHLDLQSTGLYGKLPTTIFEKPYLRSLNLKSCYLLLGSLPSQLNSSNVGSIKKLMLGGTSLSGRLPDSLGFMVNLSYMDLYLCKFFGPLPDSIGNLTEITEMYLSGNNFSGNLPSTISNLRHLTLLDLSYNHFQGEIPDAFSNLQKLTIIDFYHNSFTGSIPSSITNMSRLESLQIPSNALTGPFPSRSAGGLQMLYIINLYNNSIKSMIPSWLLSLPSLEKLDLSSNSLTGHVGKFQCKRLSDLDLSNNNLTIGLQYSFSDLIAIQSIHISSNYRVTNGGHESENAAYLPMLSTVELSSCEIEEFPNLLSYSSKLNRLDLSNNKIHGPIPSWFSSIKWTSLEYLNISMNRLTHVGDLPWQNLKYLDLQSNSLRGTFPLCICNMSELSILNLSNNKLSGEIPYCVGNFSSSLEVLDLRRNEFHGTIPTTFGTDQMGNEELNFLGLNSNHLEGTLPRSLVNYTGLEVLDVGYNLLHDTFPWWLETLAYLQILILKSNRFCGSIKQSFVSNNSFTNLQILDLSHNNFIGLLPSKLFTNFHRMEKVVDDVDGSGFMYLGSELYRYSVTLSVKGEYMEFSRVLQSFTTIDISSNNFRGGIPESLAYLYALRLLNLSHNNINGTIPQALGRMMSLEQLDLSSNQLTGNIPTTLTDLTFLAVLNLSNNYLGGRIPEGKQFSTFSNDSYVGNSALCGVPLTRACGNNGTPPSAVATVQEDHDESSFMMGFTWQAVLMGYGAGIVFGFIIGNIMICRGKPQWFVRIPIVEAAVCMTSSSKKRDRRVVRRARR